MKLLFLPLLALWLLMSACRHTTEGVNALAFRAKDNDPWGLVATDGKILIPSNTFEQQPTAVVNRMFCVPDSQGYYRLYNIRQPHQPVSPRRYFRIGHFFEEVTLAQETPQSPILIIDKQGKEIFSTGQYPQYNIMLAHNFRDGRALIATREGKYGYMDTRGRIVIPPIYDRAYDFNEQRALVGFGHAPGKIGYQLIDLNGKTRTAIQLSNCLLSQRLGNGLLMCKNLNSGQCCYLDEKGALQLCLPKEIKESYTFNQGATLFQTETGTGVMDRTGNVLIPAHYEDALITAPDRIALKEQGKWAIAEKNGNLLGKFQYDRIGRYYAQGFSVAAENGSYLFIDRNGQPTDAHRYACIAEDATLWQDVPQLFICREKEAETTEASPLPSGQKPVTPTTKTPLPSSQEKVAGSVPASSVIRADEWKKISKQNPFYEEATKVLSGKLEENDTERRQLILNYMEHLRTSYTTKDIDFLEQLFSENALIVVGTVVRVGTEAENGYLSPSQVVYNVKSKRQYLDKLKLVFKANQDIRLKFSGFRIMRHPTLPGIYGVSLRQGYSSDLYSDDGYLFLLWDFRDETAPKIHIRTWQPSMLDNQTVLPENMIFNIRDFNLQ